MTRQIGTFVPRLLDRALFAIFGVLHVALGAYSAGPWYLEITEGRASPLLNLWNAPVAVMLYGSFLLIDGIVLLVIAARNPSRTLTIVTAYALLGGFLLRLYSFIGTVLVLDSFLPPQYLSHLATVFALGALWVYVKVNSNERTIK